MPGSLRADMRRLLATYVAILVVACVWCVAWAAGFHRLFVLGALPGAVAMLLTAWYLLRTSRAAGLSPAGRRFWRRLTIATFLIAPSSGTLVASRMNERLAGPGDLVARLGGDEFAVLLPGADGREAADVATRILTELDAPVSTHGHRLMAGASVGLAERDAADDPQTLLRHADIAMYAAKRSGKGHYAPYTVDLVSDMSEQRSLAAELRRAIDVGDISVDYQPVVRLVDGYMVEVEALARWRHPLHGVVEPHEFIPVAERSDLVVRLGHSILAQACRAAAGWRQRYGIHAPERISVNVAGPQLRNPHFVADVAAVLAESGLPAHYLMLDVTASAVADDKQTRATLHGLRDLGVELALDDFGIRPSSLDLLIAVPVSRIKLDVSFLGEVGSDRRQNAVAMHIANLARDAGLDCVVVGVGTAAQADKLHALGYSLAQGFHFSPPISADEMEPRMAVSESAADVPPTARSDRRWLGV